MNKQNTKQPKLQCIDFCDWNKLLFCYFNWYLANGIVIALWKIHLFKFFFKALTTEKLFFIGLFIIQSRKQNSFVHCFVLNYVKNSSNSVDLVMSLDNNCLFKKLSTETCVLKFMYICISMLGQFSVIKRNELNRDFEDVFVLHHLFCFWDLSK